MNQLPASTDTANPKDLLGVMKPQLDFVPPALEIWVAKAMENGAKKYGPFNWRKKKVKMSIYIAAAKRHILAMLDGEDFAEDSGILHAAHAAACLGIILDARECACLIDDRPLKGAASRLLSLLTTSNPKSSGPAIKKVYIAGPMRGIKDFNFPAFFAAEEHMHSLGYETFNPARRDTNKYGASGLKSNSGDEKEITKSCGFNIREALGADCAWITKEATAIYMLQGWEGSKGANAELALAKALGLEIMFEARSN